MVFEHNWDDEIQTEKLKSLQELDFLLDYELLGSWWHELIPTQWLRDIMAAYVTRKVHKKWGRYKLTKMMMDATNQNGESQKRTS
jgi:hypothetical protein